MKRLIITAAMLGLFTTVTFSVHAYEDCYANDSACMLNNHMESHNEWLEEVEEERRHQEMMDELRSQRPCDSIANIQERTHAETYGKCQ